MKEMTLKYMTRDLDECTEKTYALVKFKEIMNNRDMFLQKEYKKMGFPNDFVSFLDVYFTYPDPFVQINHYHLFQERFALNQIEILENQPFEFLELFWRIIPYRGVERRISVWYVRPTCEFNGNEIERNYIIFKESNFIDWCKENPQRVMEQLENLSSIIMKFYEEN